MSLPTDPRRRCCPKLAPQFRSTLFQGVCSLLGMTNRYSMTFHPQTNGQVERYNQNIVGNFRTYVEDHQDRWDYIV